MSGVIRQMVLQKRAARARGKAAEAERDAIIASAKGDPGLVWRGEWQKDVQYEVGDAVQRKGSSYIALAPSLDDAPPSDAWDVLALKGKDGKAGADGKAGVIAFGGSSSTGSDFDINTLPSGDPEVTPQAILVKQNDVWVQLSWTDFLSMIGSTNPIPDNVVTVNGVPVTAGGEYVTVTQEN